MNAAGVATNVAYVADGHDRILRSLQYLALHLSHTSVYNSLLSCCTVSTVTRTMQGVTTRTQRE